MNFVGGGCCNFIHLMLFDIHHHKGREALEQLHAFRGKFLLRLGIEDV